MSQKKNGSTLQIAKPPAQTTKTSREEEKSGYYKSSLHIEQNLFGNIRRKAEEWLGLPGVMPNYDKPDIEEITGFDFSYKGLEVLHGLMQMLDRTQYKGDISEKTNVFLGEGLNAAVIICTWSDIFKACDVPRRKDGKFQSAQAKKVQETLLNELQEKRRLVYKEKTGTNSYSVLSGDAQPVSVFQAHAELSYQQAQRAAKGEAFHKKKNRLHITFHPIFLMGLENLFSPIPRDLFRTYKEIMGSQSRDKAPIIFCRYLLSVDFSPLQLREDHLLQILHFHARMDARQRSLLSRRLKKCFDFAMQAGFLQSWEKIPLGYRFFLNSERCPRLQGKQKRLKRSDESN